MTTKKIKTSDILGDNYYIYELTSSNYTPALNGTITITCTMKDVYGAAAGSKSITLYQNGTSKGAQTTNSSGVATWSITCSTAGLQKFNIKDTSIEVFVDNKSDNTHTHGNLSSDGKISSSNSDTFQYFVGVGNSTNSLYKAYNLRADKVKDINAHTNISTSANATQDTINTAIDSALSGKQATLVSGTSIKTVNNTSLLGSGNISTLTSSDIADNLTTNDSTKVLSAKQGKALNDLIGSAITYINQ